jgi:hypothetical protein
MGKWKNKIKWKMNENQISTLQLSNSLRLEITPIYVDVNAVINSNRKQAHKSHRPHYEK